MAVVTAAHGVSALSATDLGTDKWLRCSLSRSARFTAIYKHRKASLRRRDCVVGGLPGLPAEGVLMKSLEAQRAMGPG